MTDGRNSSFSLPNTIFLPACILFPVAKSLTSFFSLSRKPATCQGKWYQMPGSPEEDTEGVSVFSSPVRTPRLAVHNESEKQSFRSRARCKATALLLRPCSETCIVPGLPMALTTWVTMTVKSNQCGPRRAS